MGLDMYAYAASKELVGDKQVDLGEMLFDHGKPKAGVDTKFAYWRKFNHLHGWMRALYERKGGASTEFNCDTVRLMPEDIDQLERDADKLQPTPGYLFDDGTWYVAEGGIAFFGMPADKLPGDLKPLAEVVAEAQKQEE